MNSDGDKIYKKIIDLDEIYNFVIQTFFHLESFWCLNNRHNI